MSVRNRLLGVSKLGQGSFNHAFCQTKPQQRIFCGSFLIRLRWKPCLAVLVVRQILQSALVVRGRNLRRLPANFLYRSLVLSPLFHLWACMKSLACAGPGMRSEVGAGFAFRCHVFATSGLGVAPRSGSAGPMPDRFFVCCSEWKTRSLASRFFRYSDFMHPI